jgi:hypothetical protein
MKIIKIVAVVLIAVAFPIAVSYLLSSPDPNRPVGLPMIRRA